MAPHYPPKKNSRWNFLSKLLNDLERRAHLLKREVAALYFAYRDPRTPWLARLFCLLVVSYLLSPIDLIPDFIPILGYLDDLVLVPVGIALALRMIPPPVLVDAHQRADDPHQTKGVAILFTIMILSIWATALFYLLRAIYHLATQHT